MLASSLLNVLHISKQINAMTPDGDCNSDENANKEFILDFQLANS